MNGVQWREVRGEKWMMIRYLNRAITSLSSRDIYLVWI